MKASNIPLQSRQLKPTSVQVSASFDIGADHNNSPGGGGLGFLRTTQRQQLSQQETFSPHVLSELFPQRCVTDSVDAAALGASESAAALGATESAAALGARESTAALGARASLATGPSLAEVLHTFTLDSSASRCFFRDCTTLTPLAAPVPVSLADPTRGPVVARASTVLPCPAVPSSSLSGLHLPTFLTNLVSNAAIQDVWVDTFIPGGQSVVICQVAASIQVSASGQLAASCSCRVLSHQTLLWHHHLGHPSLPRLRGMHSRLLVSGLPKSLPSLPCSPATPFLPCVEGRQRAAPHSSKFPPTTAPLQTLHMDADVSGVLILWIRANRRQLRERFSRDFQVLRLHSDRGGEFSSDLLAEFCRDEGIIQSFTLPASPQKNGIAERRIGLIMEVARTSMIHAAAPHFLWPFAVRYAAHQLNLSPRVSELETSPTLWWTGKVGDASVFRIWGALSLVRDAKASKLSSRTLHCVFLGFPTDAPPWQFYHPRSRRVFSSQDVIVDKSGRAPSGVSQVDPPPLVEPLEISSVSSGPGEGGDLAVDDTAATRSSPRLETPPGFPPRPSLPPPQPAAVDSGAQTAGVEPGGAETEGEGSRGVATGGAATGGASSGGAATGGAATGGAYSGGPASPSGGGAVGDPAGGSPGGGGYDPAGAGASCPGGTAGAGGTGGTAGSAGGAAGAGGTRGAAGARGAGATSPRGATSARGAGPTSSGGTSGARGAGDAAGAGGAGAGGTGGARAAGPGGAGNGGAGAAGPGGACTRGAGAAGAGGSAGARGAGGATRATGIGVAGGATGARGLGAAGASGAAGAGGAGAAGTALRIPFFYPQSQSSLPPPESVLRQSLTERREPEIRASTPVRARSLARPRPPAVPGTHGMALRPSSVPQRVVLPEPPASSLPHKPDPESDLARAASPTVTCRLATVVIDPDLESIAAFAQVNELVDFAARSSLDYISSLVTESEFVCPLSDGGELALGSDVLDRQYELECLAAALPRFASMLLYPEGDPDALDIPTPRSYAEAIAGTYVDEVPPRGANIVDGMWIFRLKWPPVSPPAFKARYVARGFCQRQGVNFFQTFSPTPKMTTLRVLLHVAAQRDYDQHSLDFSTAFMQGSLHEEIWLRRPPGFTRSFPAGLHLRLLVLLLSLLTRRSFYASTLPRLRSMFSCTSTTWFFAIADTEALALVKAELQERHTCTDLCELRSYLGLQITRDRAQRTITLTQSHRVHQVLQDFGFQFSSPHPTPLSTSHSLSASPLDESVEPSGLYPELVGCLMYLMMWTRLDLAYPLSLLAHYVAPGRHRKVHWDAAKRVLCYLCSTSGMGLVLGGQGSVVLTGHSNASWADDQATQRSSQGYTFSLGSEFVSWRSTHSSSVLSSSSEVEIYARGMAAHELRWLTYLLTDLGERHRSPPVLYVDNKAMLALCHEQRLEHITKHIALRYFLARELQ
ncbi:unnamed protein product [Closterium sp. NIES-54]